MVQVEDPLETLPTRSEGICWVCGVRLSRPAERAVGTHVRCVHRSNQDHSQKPISSPSYGFTGDD